MPLSDNPNTAFYPTLAAKVPLTDATEAITGSWTFSGNRPLEGTTSRNVLRSISFDIEPGTTPGTNINITMRDTNTGTWNAPTIVDATNLAKNATVGSWTLGTDGMAITLNVTPDIISAFGTNVIYGKWNTAEAVPYYIRATLSGANLQFYITKVGSTTNLDWTAVLDASDLITLNIMLVTST